MRNEEGEGKDKKENERREKKKGLKRNGKEEFYDKIFLSVHCIL